MADFGRCSGQRLAIVAAIWVSALTGCEKAPPPPAQNGVARVAAPSWEAGERSFYAAEVTSKLALAGQELMAFDLIGELELDARSAGSETEFVARLSDAKFKAEKAENEAQFKALAEELRQPFGFSMAGGKLSAVRLPPKWSRFASGIARTLAAALQFVERPASQKGEPWTAQEADSMGTYEVEYVPGKDGAGVAKRKLRYQSVALGKLTLGQFSAQIMPKVLESKGNVALDAAPGKARLARVEYQEKLELQLSPTSLVHSATALRLKFQRQERPTTPLDWAAALAGTQRAAPDAADAVMTPATNYDTARIGDYTFDKALGELEEQARDPKGNQLLASVRGEPVAPELMDAREGKLEEQSRVFSAMAALLRTDAKNVPLAVARIRSKSPARRPLLDALASAGSAEAQQALVSLMNDAKLEEGVRRAAAFSLTRTERATPASVAALEAHAGKQDFLRVHALYGLGTIARRLRQAGEPARAEAIVQGLLRALGEVSNPASQIEALRAIANSGGASAFSAVRPFLSAESPKLKAAGIDAMRLMAHPEVDGIIAEQLAVQESDVQVAALDAVSVREPSEVLARALATAASSTARTSNRVKAVRIMGHWLSKRPELRASLEQLARDAEPEAVRQAAKAALGA